MTMNSGGLRITTPSDVEIAMTRVFDAPRAMVYDAFTKPELLKRWLGVFGGWTLDECEVELRVGGAYRYLWHGPDNAAMGMRGVYREIVPGERIVNTQTFDDPWYESEAVGTLVLTEQNGKTTATNTVRYASKEIRDAVLKSPMEHGVAAGYNALDDLLAHLQTR
jgi:uncharacterized protein YndB with AHSA1/START domain